MNITTKTGKTSFCLAVLWAITGLLTVGSAFFTNAYAASCGTSGGLDTSNVSFRGGMSDGCGGVFSGNDNWSAIQHDVNDAGNNLLFGGTNWLYQLKDETPGSSSSSGSASFLGLDWILSATAGTVGSWTLAITDPTPASFPVAADFLVVLKGSNSWAAYFFDNEAFNTAGTSSGIFNIVFSNGGGQIPNLSHLTLYSRQGVCAVTDTNCTPPPPPPSHDPVPEPTVVWMLGLGLLGLVGYKRRQSNISA